MKFLLVDVWSKHNSIAQIGNHDIIYFNPRYYLTGREYREYLTADRIVSLYRRSEHYMMSMLDDCLKVVREKNIDAMVVHQNPFPPEWLVLHTAGLIRVLGCFDDPHKTYLSTLPVLWAFHGAYYCSPSYSRSMRFSSALKQFGIENSHWFPLSYTKPSQQLIRAVESNWNNRKSQVVYIGNCYGDKVDKLAKINGAIGGRLKVYGKHWPLCGLAGFVAPFRGRKLFPKWVRSVSDEVRRDIYLSSLVGLNMHLGDYEETGNMRMYETPMHGMMLLCDVAGCDAHADIFIPDVEAVYFRSIEEAIDKCQYYFKHTEKAISIAQRGFLRAVQDYHPDKVITSLLDWASSITLHA